MLLIALLNGGREMKKIISATLIILIMLPMVFCEEYFKKSVYLDIVDWNLFFKKLHIKSEITNKKGNPRGIKCEVVFKVKYKNGSSSFHSFNEMFMFVNVTKQKKTFKVVPNNSDIEYVTVHKFKYSFVSEKLAGKFIILVIVIAGVVYILAMPIIKTLLNPWN